MLVYCGDLSKKRIKGTVDDWIQGSRVMAATGVGAMHTMQPAEILIKGERALATSSKSTNEHDTSPGLRPGSIYYGRLYMSDSSQYVFGDM